MELDLEVEPPAWRTITIEDPPAPDAPAFYDPLSRTLFFAETQLCAIDVDASPLRCRWQPVIGTAMTPTTFPPTKAWVYLPNQRLFVRDEDVLQLGCTPRWRPSIRTGMQPGFR